MPPLSTGELIAGLVGASVTARTAGRLRGVAGDGAVAGVDVTVAHPLSVIWFGLMGLCC
jgi:ABC-2 type transport system permease protein